MKTKKKYERRRKGNEPCPNNRPGEQSNNPTLGLSVPFGPAESPYNSVISSLEAAASIKTQILARQLVEQIRRLFISIVLTWSIHFNPLK